MFRIWNEDFDIKTLEYDKVKRQEAICRGRLEDYQIEFPSGRILTCNFNR